jgi:hypothetical protein
MAEETVALLARLDELHGAKEYHEIYEHLEGAVQSDPENIELLWRFARSHYDLSAGKQNILIFLASNQLVFTIRQFLNLEQTKDNAKKEKFLRDGLVLTEKMLQLDSEHWASNKWHAIMLSGLVRTVHSMK